MDESRNTLTVLKKSDTNKINNMDDVHTDDGVNIKYVQLDKEDVTKVSQEMDKGTKTLEPSGAKDDMNEDIDLSKGQENGTKYDSPSEDLIDSIEDGLVKSEDSVIEIETVLGDTNVDSNEIPVKNDFKTNHTVETNGQLSDLPINNEQKQADVGRHEVLGDEKEYRVETVEQESTAKINKTTNAESAISSDLKDSNMADSASIKYFNNEQNNEELIGATGGTETPAQRKDDDDDDDFRAMTEEEIQAIIKKYSFMDPEVRRRSLRFFWALDVDRWGYFNVTHLRYWYRAQGSVLTDSQIARIFVDLDKDRDSLVSLDEFLDEMSKKRPRRIRPDELREMFESWDINKDGYVCEDDIREKMERMDKVPNTYDIYQALSYDSKGERRLNFQDFCCYAQDSMLERMPIKQF